MKIALAQYAAIPGDIVANVNKHLQQARRAADAGAELILFPELSLTGYEPELIRDGKLATNALDPRFVVFQQLANERKLTIIVGCPTLHHTCIRISLIAFAAEQPPQTYAKFFLHQDEDRYFVAGDQPLGLLTVNEKIALSICWENAVEEHQQIAARGGATVYLCSVASSVPGIASAHERLAGISRAYEMTTLISNFVSNCSEYVCGGRSAAWRPDGSLIASLGDVEENNLLVAI